MDKHLTLASKLPVPPCWRHGSTHADRRIRGVLLSDFLASSLGDARASNRC